MLDWEVRMMHQRAVVDALHSMSDIPPPLHPEGGAASVPTIRRFIGKRYFAALETLGHTTTALDTCSCWAERIGT